MKKKYILISFILALVLVSTILIVKFNVKLENNTNTILEQSISDIDEIILEETPKYKISTYVTDDIKKQQLHQQVLCVLENNLRQKI